MALRELEVHLALAEPVPVGVLAESDGQVFFEFAPSFLQTPHTLSPYALPTRPGLQRHTTKPGVPIPGVFSDSRPDGWGLRLLHRAFADRGVPRSIITALDELAYLGDRAMGALTYRPATGPPALFEAVELGELAHHAQQVFEGTLTDVLPELVRAGGSPGGARPKALIGRSVDQMCVGEASLPTGFEPWLVKFERPEDDPECARREAVWMQCAARCGIEVPAFEVLEVGTAGKALATRRFDRTPRRHMLSAAGALDVDFRTAIVDYTDLGKLTLLLTGGNLREVEKLVCRAMFNVVFQNDDDHLKNHAWLYDGTWSLSPAYDLTWSPLRERSAPVCGEVREVSRTALIQLGTRLGLPRSRVRTILERVLDVAGDVRSALSESGCTGTMSRAAAESVEANARRLT